MNKRIGKYQIFSGLPFWIGFGRFKGGIRYILDWQLGLGILRVNKFI